jgi:ABC-type uncharacterized transport system substrate-binding protein
LILDFRWIEIPYFPRPLGEGKGEGSSDRPRHLTSIVSHGEKKNNQRGKPMRRTIITLVLATIFLANIFPAEAQQPAKIPTIGFLTAGSGSSDRVELFRREFLKLGYVERKNIAFESRNANNKYDRLPVLADELVRLKVNVIITPGSNDTRAAKNATKTIPIVFLGGSVRSGFAGLG